MGETGAKIRFAVEHVFATQKNKMKLCIRTIGTNKATVNIGIANIAYNMLRYVFHECRSITLPLQPPV